MCQHGILGPKEGHTMDAIKLWAHNGDVVRQAIELGELVHLDTASEELTEEFLLFAIESGLLQSWAKSFPDPRQAHVQGVRLNRRLFVRKANPAML
jgi:hypothetical protein